MNKEGIIKFDFYCDDKPAIIPERLFVEINPVRNFLAKKCLIGKYSDGLSYGNISIREENSKMFYITASDTGKIALTGKEHYVKIVTCDITNNFCKYRGEGLPSSETLTHYIIYNLCKDAKAVIHVHNNDLWKHLMKTAPTTSESAGYGTVEMVKEIAALFETNQLQREKLLIMKGHEDGILCFGSSVEDALQTLKAHL